MRIQKGFTLIEVLITAIITGILGAGTVYVIANSNRVMNASVKQAMVNSNVQLVMTNLSNDVKAGYTLESPDSAHLVITQPDRTIKWSFEKDYILRDGKPISFQGAENVTIDGTFDVLKSAKYYKVDVNLSMLLDDGNTFETKDIANSYYCRLEEEGYLLPSP